MDVCGFMVSGELLKQLDAFQASCRFFFRPSPSRLSPGRNTVFVPVERIVQHLALSPLWEYQKRFQASCRNPKNRIATRSNAWIWRARFWSCNEIAAVTFFCEKWRSFNKKQYFCKCNGMAGFRRTRLLIEGLYPLHVANLSKAPCRLELFGCCSRGLSQHSVGEVLMLQKNILNHSDASAHRKRVQKVVRKWSSLKSKVIPRGSSFGPFIADFFLKSLFQVEADLTSNCCEWKLELWSRK